MNNRERGLYIAVFTFLVIPYFLYLVSYGKIELYPAIILPNGSSFVYSTSDSITYEKLSIIAYNHEDQIVDIDVSQFLYPIPVNRLYAIVNNELGFKELDIDTIRFRNSLYKDIEITNRRYSTERDKDLKLWYHEKLKNLGYKLDSIGYRVEEIIVSKESIKFDKASIINQKMYSLAY